MNTGHFPLCVSRHGELRSGHLPLALPCWLSPRNTRTGRAVGVSVSQMAGRHLISRLLLDSSLTHLLGTSCVPGPRRGQGGSRESVFFRGCVSGLSPG